MYQYNSLRVPDSGTRAKERGKKCKGGKMNEAAQKINQRAESNFAGIQTKLEKLVAFIRKWIVSEDHP